MQLLLDLWFFFFCFHASKFLPHLAPFGLRRNEIKKIMWWVFMLLNSSFIIEKLLMLVGSLTFLSIIPKGKRDLNITKEKWQRSALRGRRKFVCVQGLSFLVFLWCAFFWIKKQLYCQCTIFYFCHFFSVSCIAGLSFLAWLDCRMRFIQVYALKRIYIYIPWSSF